MSTQKVALVSGANKGIGLETVRQLRDLGYFVFLGARKETEGRAAAQKLGQNVEFIALDVEDTATFPAVAAAIESRFGHLDALVNNAGVGFDNGIAPSKVGLDLVRRTFEVNVFGLIGLTQALLPLLRKSPAGRIVNVSSILGSLAMNSNFEAPLGAWRSIGYNGSKAAVNMFTATLAYELKDTLVKVNSAHPGWVKTDLGGSEAPLETPEGAETSVWLATLGADGPTGGYFHKKEKLPW